MAESGSHRTSAPSSCADLWARLPSRSPSTPELAPVAAVSPREGQALRLCWAVSRQRGTGIWSPPTCSPGGMRDCLALLGAHFCSPAHDGHADSKPAPPVPSPAFRTPSGRTAGLGKRRPHTSLDDGSSRERRVQGLLSRQRCPLTGDEAPQL